MSANADPRGPHRKCVATDVGGIPGATQLACGHVRPFNQCACYVVGHEYRCFACGPHGAGEPAPVPVP